MKILMALGLVGFLAGCGGGSFASLPGFGSLAPGAAAGTPGLASSRHPSLAPPRGYGFVRDDRPAAGALIGAELSPTPTGAILLARARLPVPGYWDAGLALVGVRGGVALYEFRARPPQGKAAGRPAAIAVASHLSRRFLAGLRAVEVRAASGRRRLRP